MVFELDIQERLIQFAGRMVKFCDSMPVSIASDQIKMELIQSGLPPAVHYSAAVHTRESAVAVDNLQKAAAALNQNEIWLRIVGSAALLPESRIEPLLDECQQLQRIINASLNTVLESGA